MLGEAECAKDAEIRRLRLKLAKLERERASEKMQLEEERKRLKEASEYEIKRLRERNLNMLRTGEACVSEAKLPF